MSKQKNKSNPQEPLVFKAKSVIDTGFSPEDAIDFEEALAKVWDRTQPITFDFTDVTPYTALFFNQTLSKHLVMMGEDAFNELVTITGLSKVGQDVFQISISNAKQFAVERTIYFLPILFNGPTLLNHSETSTQLYESENMANQVALGLLQKIAKETKTNGEELEIIYHGTQGCVRDKESKACVAEVLVAEIAVREGDGCLKVQFAKDHGKNLVVAATTHPTREEAIGAMFFSQTDAEYYSDVIYVLD